MAFVLSSCFQEDERVPPHIPGEVETGVAEMGPYYSQQIYFDLVTNTQLVSSPISKHCFIEVGGAGKYMICSFLPE